jgi:hypothetical protein
VGHGGSKAHRVLPGAGADFQNVTTVGKRSRKASRIGVPLRSQAGE